ncbi:MAG: ERCC4 domain-containing protein, partial [Thermoplasmatota archaeon]
ADAFLAFVDKTREEARGPKPSKANRVLADDPDVAEAYNIAKHDTQDNPKLGRTSALVQEALANEGRVIVFANYRSTVEIIAKHLETIPGAKPVVFVGQGNRNGSQGLTQKQQQELLQAFRDGTHNVLCATSVAEEGLDIPATDLVVFYEPIPSEIRSIQRRGRTGRHGAGRVVVLMTKGTGDEAAHWSAKRKEQSMVQELHALRSKYHQDPLPKQQTLGQETQPKPAPAAPVVKATGTHKVIADNREQAGGVVRALHELGVKLETRNLDIGDFVLSDRIVVERKTWSDLLASLVDGRLFEQLKALQSYPKPILLLEGPMEGGRGVSMEALHGAMASIVVDLGIPIMQTPDARTTAEWLASVAKREQTREKRKLAIRQGKPMDDAARVRYILAGFPGIDGVRSEALLRHFGSVARILTASTAEL